MLKELLTRDGAAIARGAGEQDDPAAGAALAALLSALGRALPPGGELEAARSEAARWAAAARARGLEPEALARELRQALGVALARADAAGGAAPHEERALWGLALEALAAASLAQDEERGEAARRLGSEVVHDLRSPLQATKIAAGLLRRDLDAARQRNALELLRRSLDQLEAVLEGALVRARLGAALATRAQAVDLRELAHASARAITGRAEARGLAVEVRAPAPAPVHADRALLGAALEALLASAVELGEEEEPIVVRVIERGEECRVEVDPGSGVDPDEAAALIDPGAHPARALAGAGVGRGGLGGLGLPLAAQVARALGGALELVRHPAGGCRFALQLPSAARKDEEARRSA